MSRQWEKSNFDILPQRSGSPAVEVVNLKQDPEFPPLLDQPRNLRGEGLTGVFGQLAGNLLLQNVADRKNVAGFQPRLPFPVLVRFPGNPVHLVK